MNDQRLSLENALKAVENNQINETFAYHLANIYLEKGEVYKAIEVYENFEDNKKEQLN